MPKKNRLFVYLFILVLPILVVFFAKYIIDSRIKNFQISKEVWEGDFYIKESGDNWQPLSKEYIQKNHTNDLIANLPEQMSGGNSQVYRQLVKGYFIKYEQNKEILTIRSSLPGSNLYRDLQIIVPNNQLIYCWPNYRDGIDVKKILFDLKTPPIINLPEEKPLVFETALQYLDLQSFFIIQLQKDVSSSELNETMKVVWLCE